MSSTEDPTVQVPIAVDDEARSIAASSYRSALRATSVTALSSVLVLALRLVRTKIMAVLLGPAGIGLFGTLGTLLQTVQTVADLGLRGSAVRQIAVASEANDVERTARVVKALRFVVLVLGLAGTLAVILVARPLSQLSFGTTDHYVALLVVSLAVFFSTVNNGQRALLRGTRRITDLAKSDVWAAFWGTAATVALLWVWRLDGIAPSLVIASVVSVIACWYYARRIRLPAVTMSHNDLRMEVRGMLNLGLVFLVTGVLATIVQFAMRAVLVRDGGLELAGQFQAAATLSMIYVGFVMGAMGQDFYPRLTGVASDGPEVNRLTNEQIELSVLLAAPGILATAVLAPVLIRVLYSEAFVVAAEVLRWQCLGVLLRVASQPLAYVLMARGDSRAILATEGIASLLQFILFWALFRAFGLTIASMALAATYAIYTGMVYVVVRRATGYRWSSHAVRVLTLACLAFVAAVLATVALPRTISTMVGLTVAVAFCAYSYRSIARMTNVPLARRLMAAIDGAVRSRFR